MISFDGHNSHYKNLSLHMEIDNCIWQNMPSTENYFNILKAQDMIYTCIWIKKKYTWGFCISPYFLAVQILSSRSSSTAHCNPLHVIKRDQILHS